jgi:osmoprotectant transport system permease protein
VTTTITQLKPRAKWSSRAWWLLALWALAFLGFSQQLLWAKLLEPLGGALYERNTLLELTWQHLQLSLSAMIGVLVIGLPLVAFSTRTAGKVFLPLLENILSVGQTFPPTAVLFLMLPILGFGPQAAILSLLIYGLLPTVRGGLTGIQNVPQDALEAAQGSGMNPTQLFWRLELPLALPSLLAGIRTSLILIIATATIAPLVGTGGLGVPIIAGLGNGNLALVLEGAIPVAMLALLSDSSMRTLESLLTPWKA